MGTLVAKKYPTTLFMKAADHTYVECGTGAKGWGCWGGKSGGTALRSAPGSTKRADRIAGANERAGITCYLVNGVCHQAANRILLPAGITVRGARGYGVSEAMFGTYGRVGFWPCHAPFNQHSGVTGDLSACIPSAQALDAAARATPEDQRDWAYTRAVLALYRHAQEITPSRGSTRSSRREELSAERSFEAFHLELFENQCAYSLGPSFDKTLSRKLVGIRRTIERAQLEAARSLRRAAMTATDFVAQINALTVDLQERLRGALKPAHYQSLLDLSVDEEPIVLADPAIVVRAFSK
jgi:hypothetical protein